MFHTQSLQTTPKTMTTIRALLTFKMSDITTLQSPHNVSTTVNQKESGLNSTCALPSCYSTLHIALASVVVVAIMIGIIFGNIMVILAILTDNQLRSIQNSFLVSLAVADLLVGLLIMPLCLSYELMGYWYFGEVLCELWLAMDVLLTTASILNLCIISLDRYWSITRAVEYVKKRTPFRAGIMIATAWIISAIICLPPLIGWKKPQKPHRCELTDDIGYVLYSTTGSFFIPLIIILVVYGNIFRAAKSRARRHVKNLSRKPAENNGVSMNSMPRAETKRSIGSYYEEIDSESGEHSPHALEKNESEMDTSHPKLGYSSHSRSASTSGSSDGPRKSSGCTKSIMTMVRKNKDDTLSSNGTSNGRRVSFSNDHLVEEKDEDKNEKPHFTFEQERPVHNGKVTFIYNQSDNSKGGAKAGSRIHAVYNKIRKKKSSVTSAVSRMSKYSGECESDIDTGVNTETDLLRRHNERQKRRLARAREKRASLVVGVIIAAFTLCWFPFFFTYVLSVVFKFKINNAVFAVIFWLGYCNSGLNPLIYTLFNKDFKVAFRKLIWPSGTCSKRRRCTTYV